MMFTAKKLTYGKEKLTCGKVAMIANGIATQPKMRLQRQESTTAMSIYPEHFMPTRKSQRKCPFKIKQLLFSKVFRNFMRRGPGVAWGLAGCLNAPVSQA